MESLIFEHLKENRNAIILLLGLLFGILTVQYVQKLLSKKESISLDQMIPEDFVLMPIEIQNSEDILPFIGSYGVANLYSYSKNKGIPQDIVALALKIIPPLNHDSRFSAIIPEQEVSKLFQHEGPFYAVIQNPKKKNSKIFKKKLKKSLMIIEEGY